jgi:TolB-like protein
MAKKTRLISVLLVCCLGTVGIAQTQSLDDEIARLADKIGKALVAKGSKSVAAVDFTDLEGQPTELGRFLSEQLTVEIVANSSLTMVDRANIKHILAEHKLTVEGLVDPANAKKLGEFAGVDTILVGNITEIDDGYRLTVKAISTSTAQIVTAGWINFKKTFATQDIAYRGLSSTEDLSSTSKGTIGTSSGVKTRTELPIAVRDLGSLRVSLKSVAPIRLNGQRPAIRISFELSNRETRRSMVVALNGEGQNHDYPTGDRLRSGLQDDRGGVWNLRSSDLSGLGFVNVGSHGRRGQDAYSSWEIVRLLQLRDRLGRDSDDPSDGFYANADSCGEGGCNVTFGSSTGITSTRKFFPYSGNTFISGSPTTIEPGQSVIVTMTFVPQSGEATNGSMPSSFQFHCEFVMGLLDGRNGSSYLLQNLNFDRVTMPAN